MTVKIKINDQCQRNEVVMALIDAGYRVRVEETKDFVYKSTYYIIFDDETIDEASKIEVTP